MGTKPSERRQALDCLKKANCLAERLGAARGVLESEYAALESLGIPTEAMRAAADRVLATQALCSAIAHECEAKLMADGKAARP
jgi:hypothetical protein